MTASKRQAVSGEYHKQLIFNMAAVTLALNGCDEIENLLKFCEIPTERMHVKEGKEVSSSKVPVFISVEGEKGAKVYVVMLE